MLGSKWLKCNLFYWSDRSNFHLWFHLLYQTAGNRHICMNRGTRITTAATNGGWWKRRKRFVVLLTSSLWIPTNNRFWPLVNSQMHEKPREKIWNFYIFQPIGLSLWAFEKIFICSIDWVNTNQPCCIIHTVFIIGFQRNPRIKLAALPWAFPGWIGGGTSSPYHNPNVLADYVTRWLVAARDIHNLTINSIGVRGNAVIGNHISLISLYATLFFTLRLHKKFITFFVLLLRPV